MATRLTGECTECITTRINSSKKYFWQGVLKNAERRFSFISMAWFEMVLGEMV